jgi:hypothetical protein
VHDGRIMEPTDALRTFRRSLYECLHRREDAHFELADAILAADGAAPSPAHLSLQASHRRGWGSLYAALDRGRIEAEDLLKLLARHPLALGGADETPVSTPWTRERVGARCDAETSPVLKASTTIRPATPPVNPSSPALGLPVRRTNTRSSLLSIVESCTVRRKRRQIWISSSARMCGVSIWSTPSASSSRGWTTPRVRHPEQADRWTWLVVAVFSQLRLARACVADLRLPWERRYDTCGSPDARASPSRRFVAFGGAGYAREATESLRGRSPGRPKGRLSGPAKRYPAIRKAA